MKKNLLGFFAMALAICIVAFSAFTNRQASDDKQPAPPRYLTYDGSGPQNDLSNYNNITTAPTIPPAPCVGEASLCWIRVSDVDQNGVVNAADFSAQFTTLDSDSDGTLNDETETASLEKRNN